MENVQIIDILYGAIPFVITLALIPLMKKGYDLLKAKADETETNIDNKVIELVEKNLGKYSAKLDKDGDGVIEVFEVQEFIEKKTKGRIKGKLAFAIAKGFGKEDN